jgi:uncharacterized protein YidB (DUF937 family)
MRFLHEVIDDLGMPADDAAATPMGHVLEALLGGERGTLANLGSQFTRRGLGHIMASWISNGPNLPVRPAELRAVLGEERLRDLATLAGMPSAALLERLCELLPRAVHAMTPEGRFDASYIEEEMQRRD